MKALILVLGSLLLCGVAQGAEFGNESTATNSYFGIRDILAGGVYAPSSNGTLDTIYAYIEKAAGDAVGKAVLLRAADKSVVATGTEITFSGSIYVWVAFPISAAITSGTDYVLCVCASSSSVLCRLRRASGGGTTWEKAITYPTIPDPVVDPMTIGNYQACIYGHYTESAAAQKKLKVRKQ